VLAAGPVLADEPRRLVMASLGSNNESVVARWLALIYTDAFQQLGIELDIRNFPAARAAAEAAAGTTRRAGAQLNTRPPKRCWCASLSRPFSPDHRLRAASRYPAGARLCRGTPYRVEYQLGYPVMAHKLAAVLPASQSSEVRNAETGLRKLMLGRSDLYVDFADIVDAMLERADFRDAGIRAVTLLERGPIHAYLNRKHADLAPRLAAILKDARKWPDRTLSPAGLHQK
jgi:hypothetical protein